MSQGYDQHKTVADAEEAQGRLKLTQVLIRELEAARMLALAQPPAAVHPLALLYKFARRSKVGLVLTFQAADS